MASDGSDNPPTAGEKFHGQPQSKMDDLGGTLDFRKPPHPMIILGVPLFQEEGDEALGKENETFSMW